MRRDARRMAHKLLSEFISRAHCCPFALFFVLFCSVLFVWLFFVCFAFCGFVSFVFLLVCARSRQSDSFMDYVKVHTSSLLWLFMHVNSISGK